MSLHNLIQCATNKYFGTIVDTNTIDDAAIVAKLVANHFGVVTAEYSMKWPRIQPRRGAFDFGAADRIAAFARRHGLAVRGHVLVWGDPRKITDYVAATRDPADLEALIVDHISTVVSRYKGQFRAWDVVNEPFNDGDSNLRASVFTKLLGERYIDIAFHAARAADPTAKLYLNEYGMEYNQPKFQATLALVQRLQARGVPIDGVGFQAHLTLGQSHSLKENMQRFAALGLEVAVTELDVKIPLKAGIATPQQLHQQAAEFVAVVNDACDVAACVGVSTWSICDRLDWVPTVFAGFGASTLFDANLEPKPALHSIIECLRKRMPSA